MSINRIEFKTGHYRITSLWGGAEMGDPAIYSPIEGRCPTR